MSQQTFLDELSSWKEEQWLENIDYILPQFIGYLNNDLGYHKVIDAFKTSNRSIQSCIDIKELESRYFSKVFPKIRKSFCNILVQIAGLLIEANNNVDEVKLQLETDLFTIISYIECLESSVLQVTAVNEVKFSEVHSLVGCVLEAIKESYEHCKTSSTNYGINLLNMFSKPLTNLFKKTHSLQMVFLSLIDKIDRSGKILDKENADIVLVCWELFEISQIVFSLDVRIMVTTWKAISKVMVRNKQILRHSNLDIDLMVTGLSSDVQKSVSYLFPNELLEDDRVGVNKSLRILGIQMKILLMLIKEFDISKSVQIIFDTFIHFRKYLPPNKSSENLPNEHVADVKKHISGPEKEMLLILIENENFVRFVLEQFKKDYFDYKIPYLLFMTAILELLVKAEINVIGLWINQGDISFPKVVFKFLNNCRAEMCLPLKTQTEMPNLEPKGYLNLYENLLVNISAFICVLPSKYLEKFEIALFENVLDSNSLHVANDVWCLLVRYGNLELCASHCMLLGKLYSSLEPNKDISYQKIGFLLKRLLQFLSPKHQMQFFEQFPVTQFVEIWSIIPWGALPGEVMRNALEILVRKLESGYHNLAAKNGDVSQHFKSVLSSIKCFNNAFVTRNDINSVFAAEQVKTLLQVTLKMWVDIVDFPRVIHDLVLPELLQISQHLVIQYSVNDIIQILRVLVKIVNNTISVYSCVTLGEMLSVFGRKSYEESVIQKSEVLALMPHVFGPLLSHGNMFVHQNVISVFAKLAEETELTDLVPGCISFNEELQETVIRYIQKVPFPSEKFSSETYVAEQFSKLPASRELAERDELIIQPPAKRRRSDQDEIKLKSLINILKDNIQNIIALQKTQPLPAWAKGEINVLRKKMSDIQ